ncbi:hypothetical protein [Mastigocoleus testarum]|uniref:Uncharacterized protein n=1 Tax=Mastigocoleus testarum BC008 TaxID=371196 RepID=A0A0V7ZCM7_9CYAN|nr:hypothetical protein [Mastigocoleus testarum]KST62250.1 hypothetical protein BC008_08765 [Mastigocoleus testarum BC008]
MLLELNFSAIEEAEKVIQEMKDKIDACRMIEDRAVEHLEVSRELSKSLVDNGLKEKGFSSYKNTLSEIWGLGNTPISLDQEYEQLKSKFSMTVQTNKELLIEKQKLESKIKELEALTDSLDNSEQELNLHSENLQVEINDLRSTVEKLTTENNFYSQENASLKKQKLDWVVNKDENQRIAQLKSKIAELESENQSLEWQKDKAIAMVEEKAEQAIPQASWKVNDIVQVIGTQEVVKIIGYSSDKKFGHFLCQMPDGENKEYFTGQLRFVQSADVGGGEEQISLNSPTTPQTDPELPLELGDVGVVEPIVPAQERANNFKTGFNKKTTWEDFRLFALKDSEVLTEISGFSGKTGKKVKEALPSLCADYILRSKGDRSDFEWINSPTFEKLVEQEISQLEPQKILQQAAVEFFASHNSPKKLQQVRWETVREYAQGCPQRIDALIKCASASGKENSKTKFCDNLESLLVDYIVRTGERSDLDWVPFANLVLMKLGESNAVSKEDASQETALSKVNSASILQPDERDPATEVVNLKGKISDCKTVEQLEEISGCNPSNIKDADDAGVIVDIYENHVEKTGEFDKLNWLPESIRDEIYQRLGRGSRPLDFEIGEKVRGVDLYSAYCSKAGVVTRLTPGLISVAWEDGKFNTHYAEELEIIPESLALQVA